MQNLIAMIKFILVSLASVTMMLAGLDAQAQDKPTPYVTENTVFIKKDVVFSALPPVSDGKFTLNEYNRSLGYGSYWSSWTIEGVRLFGPEWENFGREKPRWDNGVCVFKDPKARLGVMLHEDGTIREFRKNCGQVSQFADGIAMVVESLNDSVVSYYINTMGEKIYPHLEESDLGYRSIAVIRPVKCGLRAYYSNKEQAWGYLDASGNNVIEAKYQDVRDFANGYALVVTKGENSKGYVAVIDQAGSEVCKVLDGSFFSLDAARNISDVSAEGVYAISDNSGANTKYYSVKPHKEVHATGTGMGFVEGYAFMIPQDASEECPQVYDKNFKKVGSWNFNYYDFAYRKPVFSPYGLLTVKEGTVLSPKGEILLKAPEDGKIGDFCEEGYAPFEGQISLDGKGGDVVELTGYCRETGEIALAFCNAPLPVVKIKEDTIRRPIKNDPRIRALYDVRVIAHPEKGGVVYGSGKYEEGDTIRVTGSAAEGYCLAGVKADKSLKKTQSFNRFVVNGDGNITCYFMPEIDANDPDMKGGYLGSTTVPQFDGSSVEVPIWLELDKDKVTKSPYGDNTSGFLAITYDPSFRHHLANESSKEDEVFVNMMMVPMLVTGVQFDPYARKTYLMLKGGEVAVGNIFIKDNNAKTGKSNGLNTLLANLMMMIDGFQDVKITPAQYRIEILDGTIGDESFTFGELQRLSAESGWLPGGHEEFTTRKKGLFVRAKASGLPHDLLAGRKMVRSDKKPQIWWYPTDGFYGGTIDKESLEKVIKKMEKSYREYTSDVEEVKKMNFSDFFNDLENNRLKCLRENK